MPAATRQRPTAKVQRAAKQAVGKKRTRSRSPAGTKAKPARVAVVAQRSGLSRRASLVVEVLGNRNAAQLLGVSESQPSRWRKAEELPGARVAPLLVDLDHVIGRLLLVWDASVVPDWLASPNAFLTGARPIDVIRVRGSAAVAEAIDAEASGAFA